VVYDEVATDSIEGRILREEEELCQRVRRRLEGWRPGEAGPDYDAQLVALRDQVAEEKPEDHASLVEQMTRLANVAARRQHDPAQGIDRTAPYFAHLGLEQQGRRLDILIGRRGFVDHAAGVTIVDWRDSPVSRLYYSCEEGEEYEEEFGGRDVEGRVVVRRGLTLQGGRLRRIAAPQAVLVCDERGTWLRRADMPAEQLAGGVGKAVRPPRAPRTGPTAAARGRILGDEPGRNTFRPDKHLPEITALIDREQFERIIRPGSGVTIVQGGAGSGKTTVALHRVAFLHYADPTRYRAARCLVVVLNESLVDYVQRVLPSLGVAGVPVLTGHRWAQRLRQRLLPDLRLPTIPYQPEVVARLKQHPAMLPVLEGLVGRQTRGIERELRQRVAPPLALVEDEPPLDEAAEALWLQRQEQRLEEEEAATQLAKRWAATTDQPLIPRLQSLAAWLDRAGLATGPRHRARVAVQDLLARARDLWADWGELFTDRRLLGDELARHAPGAFGAAELDEAVSWCVGQLELPAAEEDGERPVDAENEEILGVDGRELEELLPTAGLDPTDEPLLLRLHQLKHGRLQPPSGGPIEYAHAVVDEAQDLSAVELRVLLDATRDQSLTLAGDMAQKLVFSNSIASWPDLLAGLGVRALTLEPLRISYRSTRAITLLAREVLGELADPLAPRCTREGAPVELFSFAEEGPLVAFLAAALRSLMGREPSCSVAVILREPGPAKTLYEALERAGVPRLRHVANHDFRFEPGIEVTDVAQVKGLEFDYVVLPDAHATAYPASPVARHALHIATPRAAHQLWLLSPGEPSPLLPRAPTGELAEVFFRHEL